MTESEHNSENIIEQAIQRFIDTQLQGQKPDIDEFAKQYPKFESQIKQMLQNLDAIDNLFDCLMQADNSDFGNTIEGHDLIGQKLGDFEILKMLGQGGMGAVFLAQQASLDRKVALKVISSVGGPQAKNLDRFKRESKVLAQISHPNIVPIYEVGQHGSYLYFAMEYLKGVSLDKILSSISNAPASEKASTVMHNCLEVQGSVYEDNQLKDNNSSGAEIDTDYIIEISRIIVSIASALNYAHEKGILHRDIKPSNILIASDGTAKLVDFGLAKTETQQSITVTGEFFGTPSYVSPEQIRKPDTVDCRSDVFSLAATFYECLTLHVPFGGDTVNDTLTRVISQEAIPPKKYCPRLSTDFNTVLLHALEKSPEDRYQTAGDFVTDIKNILEFKPIIAKRPSITQRAYKTLRRNPLKIAIIGVSILVMVLGYFLFFSHIQSRNKTLAEKLYEIALVKYEKKEFAEALEFFEKSVKANPADGSAYYGLGECYKAIGKHQKSIESYQKAIRIKPDYIKAYLGLSTVYIELGRFEEGLQILKKAVKINPDNCIVYNNIGLAYTELGRYEEAIQALKQVLNIDPNNAFAYSNLATAYAKLENYENAIQAYKRSLEIDPGRDMPLNNLGVIYNNLGRHKEAVELCNGIITINPNNANAYRDLGLAYRGLGDFEKAVTAYSNARRIDPNNALVSDNLGFVYNILGRYHEAIKATKQAIKIDPNNASAYNNLGFAYINLGLYKEAIESIKKSIQIDPNNAFAYSNLSAACDYLGLYNEAIKAVNQSIRVNKNNASSYKFLGFIYIKLGQYEEGLQAFKQAVEMGAHDANTYNDMATSLERLGRYPEAERTYKQAIEVDPDNDLRYNNIAIFYGSMGRYEESVEFIKKAIGINPNNSIAFDNLGFAYNKLGLYNESASAHKKAIEIDPNYVIPYNNLGVSYLDLGSYDEAIKFFKQAIIMDPNYAVAHANLGIAYSKLGDMKKSIESYKQSIKLNPKNIAVYNQLIVSYRELGLYQDAIEVSKQTCELSDYKNDLNFAILADNYAEVGDFNSAIENQEKAIAILKNKEVIGVGIQFDNENGITKILNVIPESSGQKSGLVAGDIIEAVDNIGVKDMLIEDVTGKISGPVGTKVTLTIRSAGESDSRKITIIRNKIVPPLMDEYKKRLEAYKAQKPWRQ